MDENVGCFTVGDDFDLREKNKSAMVLNVLTLEQGRLIITYPSPLNHMASLCLHGSQKLSQHKSLPPF